MALLVGFHVEGYDHLILRAFLAKLLDRAEDELYADVIDASGRGWHFVLETAPKALNRFYGKCAQAAILGIDNDGNRDLASSEVKEDPAHLRHWNHPDQCLQKCRYCRLQEIVSRFRKQPGWVPQKPATSWPVVIVVPVEAIEAWLLAAQAVVEQKPGWRHAELSSRRNQKRVFYGKPEPTKRDIEDKALPVIRRLEPRDLQELREGLRSFAQFAEQVDAQQAAILGAPDCWQAGDRAAQR